MQENYKILGISESATDEEVENAYNTLKEKYQKDRFLEGEAGNLAAKNLTKIKTAYQEIKEDRKKKKNIEGKAVENFDEVERLIRNGDLTGAQNALDAYNDRTAEWHYLQSVIFYKKNWINESKKQLEIALNMDPRNTKYADSYTKLKQKMEFNEQQFRGGYSNYYGQPGYGQQQMGGTDDRCCSYCATMCCMNLMCNMCCR